MKTNDVMKECRFKDAAVSEAVSYGSVVSHEPTMTKSAKCFAT